MAKVNKQYYLIIHKHGKNRYTLQTFENNIIANQQSYNDMTQCELAKIILESKGYAQAGIVRTSI